MKKIKATVLCENSVFFKVGALAEHGWAVYIETAYGNYLFDTGQGKAIINNANYFQKDLFTLKGIIISHHHNDHTGGISKVLNYTGRIRIYSHPGLFKKSYVKEKEGSYRYIGIPFCHELLESQGAKLSFNTEPKEIFPGLILSGEIPRETSFEKGDKDLFIIDKNGDYIKDQMLDDQTLIANTDRGLVIILGCSHAGIVNIINHAIRITGIEHIHSIIGGTHLDLASEETRKKTIESLKNYDIEKIGVSHCTGLETSLKLYKEFGNNFFFCNVGSQIEV